MTCQKITLNVFNSGARVSNVKDGFLVALVERLFRMRWHYLQHEWGIAVIDTGL